MTHRPVSAWSSRTQHCPERSAGAGGLCGHDVERFFGWWVAGLILMVICMVMMLRVAGHGHGSRTGESHGQGPGGAERILAERLARGEIDIEGYERRLAVLHRGSEHGGG